MKKPVRKVTHRAPRPDATLKALAGLMLDHAQELFDASAALDTAVRDVVYEGLARIVYAAYDTQACAECISDSDCAAYIQSKTYDWFRSHEFVEWFCVGASTLFRNSPRVFYRMRVSKPKSGKGLLFSREKVG